MYSYKKSSHNKTRCDYLLYWYLFISGSHSDHTKPLRAIKTVYNTHKKHKLTKTHHPFTVSIASQTPSPERLLPCDEELFIPSDRNGT